MNAYAMVAADEALRVANQRLADLRLEARNQRLIAATAPRSSFAGTVVSTFASIRGVFVTSGDPAPAVPKLRDYPYRG
jgi:hypothetical protein